MNLSRPPEILGSALKAARENKGLEHKELATVCCLSAKMIHELEDGGMSSFYTFELKLAAARRVAAYLGIPQEDYLLQKLVTDSNLAVPEGVNASASELAETPIVMEPVNNPVSEKKTHTEDPLQSDYKHLGLPSNQSTWMGRFKVLSPVLIIFLVAILYGVDKRIDFSSQILSNIGEMRNRPKDLPTEAVAGVGPNAEAKSDQTEAPTSAPIAVKPEEQVVKVARPSQCPYTKDDQIPSFQALSPSKAGDVVNIKTLVKQTICVIDGAGKEVIANFEVNAAQPFKGVAPFLVLSQDLDNIEMYYQGWRVRPPKSGMRQIKLIEVGVPAPQ